MLLEHSCSQLSPTTRAGSQHALQASKQSKRRVQDCMGVCVCVDLPSSSSAVRVDSTEPIRSARWGWATMGIPPRPHRIKLAWLKGDETW